MRGYVGVGLGDALNATTLPLLMRCGRGKSSSLTQVLLMRQALGLCIFSVRPVPAEGGSLRYKVPPLSWSGRRRPGGPTSGKPPKTRLLRPSLSHATRSRQRLLAALATSLHP